MSDIASPAPRVAHQCFFEARRALGVCFGLGEDLLEERRALFIGIFVAGFLAGLVLSPLVEGLAQLRRGVVGLLSWRPRVRSTVDEALAVYAAAGGWHSLGGDSAPAQLGNGRARGSRFAAGGQVHR